MTSDMAGVRWGLTYSTSPLLSPGFAGSLMMSQAKICSHRFHIVKVAPAEG